MQTSTLHNATPRMSTGRSLQYDEATKGSSVIQSPNEPLGLIVDVILQFNYDFVGPDPIFKLHQPY